MPYNDSGTFTPAISYQVDKANGVGPQAERFDQNFLDVAEGLSTALCRDGQSVVSATIPFAGHKISYLGDATLPQDAVNVRTLRSLIQNDTGVINVKDPLYGAMGDGVTDDTAAIQAALTAAANGTLFFPPGQYILKDAVSLVHAAVRIIGSGMGMTELRWAADATNNGISMSANASRQFHYIADMMLTTAKDGGTAVNFDYSDEIVLISGLLMTLDRVAPRWTAERLYIAGADLIDNQNALGDTWGNGIFSTAALYGTARDINIVCKGTLVTDTFRGTTDYNGIAFVGNPLTGSGNEVLDQNGHPVVIYVENCNITFAGVAVTAINVEGVFIRGSNFIFGDYGVVVNSEGGYNHPQCNVIQCHINNFLDDVRIDGQDHLNVQGCLLYQSQRSTVGCGVNVAAGNHAIICGNQFESYGDSGSIGIQTAGADGVISNNVFKQQGSHMDWGIVLTAASSGYMGNMNVYSGTMAIGNVSDSGSGNSVT